MNENGNEHKTLLDGMTPEERIKFQYERTRDESNKVAAETDRILSEDVNKNNGEPIGIGGIILGVFLALVLFSLIL
jgi:hypothetical protein